MLRILATIFAALLGLAFGSFLNVCLSRWPEGESIVTPRSHCRSCGRTLAWWENIPVLSWLALRGRCRTCKTAIHWRYPLIEAAVGLIWAYIAWTLPRSLADPPFALSFSPALLIAHLAMFPLTWLLVALASLDAEYLWLPDKLTLPGAALGYILFLVWLKLRSNNVLDFYSAQTQQTRLLLHSGFNRLLAILIAAALILLIRWVYWLFRRQEGIGLGDAKLMALLAAWLGLPGALLSFFFGVILGALVAVPLVMTHRASTAKLPLGTFLCIGGIVSALWGQQILDAYLIWSGF